MILHPLEWGRMYLPHHMPAPSPEFHWALADMIFSNDERVALAAPRGHAKCLSVDSRVQMANGRVVRAGDIAPGDSLMSLREIDLKIVPDTVSAVSSVKAKECLEINVRSNRTLTATEDHRVFTFDGWKLVKDLLPGFDYVAVPRSMKQISACGNMPRHEARTIGYLIAEGALSSGNCSFTNATPEVLADFMLCASAMGFTVRDKGRYGHALSKGSRSPRDWLKWLGLLGCKSGTKRIPDVVFTQSENILWEFIDSLMVTDGWFAKEAGSGGISLSNELLIDDIRHILTRLGIVTTKSFKKTPVLDSYVLVIGNDGVKKLLNNCSLVGKRSSAKEIATKDGYSLTDIYPNRIKKALINSERLLRSCGVRVDNRYEITKGKLDRMIASYPMPGWERLRGADVYWDRVESVVPTGLVETVDLQMESNYSFIADGMVVHNSTITDLICLLYGAAERLFRYCLIVSDSTEQAEGLLDEVRREVESNDNLVIVYPGLSKGNVWNQKELVFANGVRLQAMGQGKKVRGKKRGGTRPDFVLVDDLENDELVETLSQRTKLRKWFRSALLPALAPGGRIRVVGTILHSDSLLFRLLRNENWSRRLWRALADDGTALWESYRPAAKLLRDKEEARRDGLLSSWYQEFQNQPMADEESPFKPEHFRYFDVLPTLVKGLKAKYYRTLFIDPAISLKDKADFTAFTVVYASQDGYWWVMEAFRRKAVPSEILDVIMKLHEKHKLDAIGIEDVAYQRSLAFWLAERAADSFKYLPIHAIKPRGDKRSRILGLQPYFNAGRINIRNSCSGRLEEELLGIDSIDHDDLADSLAQQLELTIRPEPPRVSKVPTDPRARRAYDHRRKIEREMGGSNE